MTTSSMAMSLATTALSEARQEIERLRAELEGMTASYQQASDESSVHYQEANQLSEQLATQTARADAAERALAIIAKRATDYACENLPAGPACRFGDEIARIATDAQPVAADVVQEVSLFDQWLAPRKAATWPDDWKRHGFNYAFQTASEALRYLANNDRPIGGESRYNAEHLFQIASEIETSVAELLPALLATRQEGSKV